MAGIFYSGGHARAQCLADEAAKVTASDANAGSSFGTFVGMSGDVAIVGSPNHLGNGAAYIYRRNPTTFEWMEEAQILLADAQPGDRLGHSVDIFEDVATVASYRDVGKGPWDFRAHVYRFDGTIWAEESTIVIPEAHRWVPNNQTYPVAMTDTLLVVGAYRDVSFTSPGSVHLYRYDGLTWTEEAVLQASDGEQRDAFGFSVAIEGDVVIIGAPVDDDNGPLSGSAYIFRYDHDLSLWVEEQKLLPSDGNDLDQFGWTVAISSNVAIVGANRDDDNGSFSGSAYVYRYNDRASAWKPEEKLFPSDSAAGAVFGSSVAVADDIAVIGAAGANGYSPESGAVYLFQYDKTNWVEQAKLVGSHSETINSLGIEAAISGDAVIVGDQADGEHGHLAGAALVFRGLSDCNENGTLDICDVSEGTSQDVNGNGILDECECLWDLDGNGGIGHKDLVTLLTQWRTNPGGPPDFDGDGTVAVPDLLLLLANWGPCP